MVEWSAERGVEEMKPQEAVVKETKHIAIGTFALVAVMVLIYAAVGRFSWQVLAGGVYAGAVAVGNFFALGMTVQHAVNGIQGEDENEAKNARAKVRLSYSTRMLAVFGLAVVAIAVLKLDPLASLLPLLFPRITIAAMHIRNRGKTKGSEKE